MSPMAGALTNVAETLGGTPPVALDRLSARFPALIAMKRARKGRPGSLVVTVVCDTGLKYRSTELYPA